MLAYVGLLKRPGTNSPPNSGPQGGRASKGERGVTHFFSDFMADRRPLGCKKDWNQVGIWFFGLQEIPWPNIIFKLSLETISFLRTVCKDYIL